MKFSLISDMHVDFPQPKTPYDKLEKLVVVAGDTSNGLLGLKFLQKLRNKGFEVVACDGNHEQYSNLTQSRTIAETTARFREDFPVVTEDPLTGTPFVAVNGWYPVTVEATWRRMMNDSYNGAVYADEMNRLAEDSAQFLESVFQAWRALKTRGVAVTHTSPCEETLDPAFDGHLSNEWYWNPYMRPLLSKYSDVILVWCHGHTHAKNEAIVDGVRVVCNPRGYPGENPGWEPLTIEV